MRNSRVLREVKEGKFAPCLKLGIVHPSVPDHAIRAAKIHDMDVIVRVSKGSYSEHSKSVPSAAPRPHANHFRFPVSTRSFSVSRSGGRPVGFARISQ